jgi:TIR domain
VTSPVFISYASVDQGVAETICDALQARGHPCWIACRSIGPGENFQESIVRAIRSARVMLLIFTGNANNSEEIKKELVLAGRHRVTVLPVRVEDVVPNDAFAYEFATRQWIDLFKDWEREIDRLGAQIDAIVTAPRPGASGGSDAMPAPRSQLAPLRAAQKPSRIPLIAAVAIIVAAIGAGGIYFSTRTAPIQPAAAPASSTAAIAAPAAAPAPAVSPPAKSQAPAPPPIAVATPTAPQPAPTPQPAASAPMHGFDGDWSITFSCPAVGSALGYSYRVAAQISDGLLHGEKGEKGKPGWLTIDGKIGPDGSLDNLYVDSLVGASQVAVGNVPRGTEFGYHVAGKLGGSSGAGRRVEGRPCTLDFAKQ